MVLWEQIYPGHTLKAPECSEKDRGTVKRLVCCEGVGVFPVAGEWGLEVHPSNPWPTSAEAEARAEWLVGWGPEGESSYL